MAKAAALDYQHLYMCVLNGWETHLLTEDHIGQEDEESLEEGQDGKQVVEGHDVVVDREQTKHPSQAGQWREEDGHLQTIPASWNNYSEYSITMPFFSYANQYKLFSFIVGMKQAVYPHLPFKTI